MGTELLSIIIPAYNEERYLGALLRRIRALELWEGLDREIIVVDDASTDRTGAIAAGFEEVLLKRLEPNAGKGGAVRAGLALARGDYILIQDADLEYDPGDYAPMLQLLRSGGAQIVYGSRYMGGGWLRARYPGQSWAAYLGGRSLSLAALLCTGRYLSDTATALKLFKSALVKNLNLESAGFELDHEITAKLLARGHRIAEVPVHYFPRSRAEGKKIGPGDWLRALRTFYRYRRG